MEKIDFDQKKQNIILNNLILNCFSRSAFFNGIIALKNADLEKQFKITLFRIMIYHKVNNLPRQLLLLKIINILYVINLMITFLMLSFL